MARYWHKHGLPPARLRNVTWLEVAHRYWRDTGYRYHASTAEICTVTVPELKFILHKYYVFMNISLPP